MTLPLAHLGHYLWALYLLPVAIVIAGILKSTLKEKRPKREAEAIPPPGGTGREAENEDLARRPPSP